MTVLVGPDARVLLASGIRGWSRRQGTNRRLLTMDIYTHAAA